MEFDQSSMIKTVTSIGPTDGQITGNGTVNGAVVDVNQNERFESLTYEVHAGTITDGSHALLLEESDTGAFGGEETVVAADDLIGGVLPGPLTSSESDTVVRLGVIAKKQFQRLSVVSTGVTTGGAVFAGVILGHPHQAPVAAQP